MKMDNLCHCGTLDDAVKAAISSYDSIANKNCPVWAMQIGIVYGLLATAQCEDFCIKAGITGIADSEKTYNSLTELLILKIGQYVERSKENERMQ